MVISVKEDFALVVMNLGQQARRKDRDAFQVWRGEQRIGDVRVVDVREKISRRSDSKSKFGKRKIKVGDRLRVDAQNRIYNPKMQTEHIRHAGQIHLRGARISAFKAGK